MALLRELIALITVPPGDLVYHLVTLFAIQLILGIAFGHWNRHRLDPKAIRLLVTGVGFAFARALLMLVAVLDRLSSAHESNSTCNPNRQPIRRGIPAREERDEDRSPRAQVRSEAP
jgi:hypothetical protein